MRRRIFSSLLLLLILAFTVQAQGNQWRAWLYNPLEGRLTLVDDEGLIRDEVRLPIPLGFDFYSFEMAISASGERVAYIVTDNQTNERQLFVYDTRLDRPLATFTLPATFADGMRFISNDNHSFNTSETALAFGFSLADGGWQIIILDLRQGLISLILRSSTLADLPSDIGLTPVIQRYTGTEVAFTLVDASIPGASIVAGSYAWDTATNSVREDASYPALDNDTLLTTDEVLTATSDVELPNNNTAFAVGQNNALYVYDPQSDEPFPFYNATELSLFQPRFVQGGARILVSGLNPTGEPFWQLLDRNGRLVGEWRIPEGRIISGIKGVAGGFIYTMNTVIPGGESFATLAYVDRSEPLGEGTPLWISSPGTSPRLLRVIEGETPQHENFIAWGRAASTATLTETVVDDPAASAIIDGWHTWIYQVTGRVTRLDDTGKILNAVDLPLLESDEPPQRIAVSPSGDLFAYVVGVNGRPSHLEVYDIRSAAIIMTFILPQDGSASIPSHTLERVARARVFNADETALAFGFGLGQSGWQIVILDLENQRVINLLRHDDPAMAAYDPDTSFGVVPVIERFESTQVFFTIQPAGEIAPPYGSFTWDSLTGAVIPNLLHPNAFNSVFADEVIMSMADYRLSNIEALFDQPQLNALHVYDPQTQTRFPFYVDEAFSLAAATFIQNGERVLIERVGPDEQSGGWVAIERDGSFVGITPLPQVVLDQAGTVDGFLYIPRTEDSELTVFHINTRTSLSVSDVIWRRLPPSSQPQIAWVSQSVAAEDFIPWAQIAPPTGNDVFFPPTPVPEAPTAGGLVIGSQVTVNTTDGDQLNLRGTPGRGGDIITRLPDGLRVEVLDGPREVGGLEWWLVRTPSDTEGWVVASVDGVRTLVSG